MAVATGEEPKQHTVYLYDMNKSSRPFIGSKRVLEGVALEQGQTTIQPIDGKENFFNGQGWTDKLVMAYEYDPAKDNEYKQALLIPQGQQLGPNQTFTKPKDGLYWPIHFNGVEWVGVSKEEFLKAHSAKPLPVSQSTLAMNMLGQQFVQAKIEADKQDKSVQAKIDQLTQSVNLLGQMIAKSQSTQAQGGTN